MISNKLQESLHFLFSWKIHGGAAIVNAASNGITNTITFPAGILAGRLFQVFFFYF